jgi:hypothetical protein
MPRAGFYNDNEYREYPFIPRLSYAAADLPHELIVDCGFIMGLDSEFNPTTHAIYLDSVTKTGTKLQFVFKTTAPGALNNALVFERNLPAEDWEYEHVESLPAPINSTANGVFCATEPAWSGFIVTGRLNAFAEALSSGVTLTFAQERAVEPGRVQSLVRAYLRAIGVANYSRVVIPPCGSNTPPVNISQRPVVVNSACIKGHIQLQAGFNCEILQDSNLNELRISPSRDANTTGLSAAEFCLNGSEIKLYQSEMPPTGSKFLSGGPACDEVIAAINGLPAPDVKIVGGAGIQIVADANAQHTLRIQRVENLLSQTC